MFMLCWFYCVPFLHFLYYAVGPFLFIYALFVRRRGVYRGDDGLEKLACILMGIASVKVFLADMRSLGRDLLCASDLSGMVCNGFGWQALQMTGFLMLTGSLYLTWNHFRRAGDRRAPLFVTRAAQVRFWANAGMALVIFMAVWQLSPWFFYLVIGRLPFVFTIVPWAPLTTAALIVLLMGFWKLEACPEYFGGGREPGQRRSKNVWTPRDTLWLAIFIYAITLGLSYVAHDIMAVGMKG